jgi:hypothetical protein
MITAVSDITQISDRQFKARIFRGGYVEIFINPSQSEIIKVASKKTNRIRFTADTRSPHKIWVWDASKAIHYEMLPLLGGDRCDVYPYILGGVAELQGSNAVMIGWDNFHHVMNVIDSCSRENVIEFLSKLFSYDWSWLNEYFLVTDYIEKRKLEFEMKIEQRYVGDNYN